MTGMPDLRFLRHAESFDSVDAPYPAKSEMRSTERGDPR